ncbi:MAG: HNH endonuclease [Candidatus Zixiibacteriota bacterium]|nr:MAG: HNH endonuclease [candidate division Zixibacteria bacterium]
MKDDILTYREMCDREQVQTLQRGMNFRLNPAYSVILMSQRRNAPYNDTILADGLTILYEGHDIPKTGDVSDPKKHDQALYSKTGKLTQNGKFAEAVKRHRAGGLPEKVRAYEKLFNGVWSFRGTFELIDYEYILQSGRQVFKYQLKLADDQDMGDCQALKDRTRVIPTEIKKQVWKRDAGRCVICGAEDELHFDHDIPYSKGGSSITADNVRILCARHNIAKSNKIE